MPQSGSALSIPEALGVVGIVLPDKNPLVSMVTLLGAAIATGNAVIMVPSQKYPLAALAFIQVRVEMWTSLCPPVDVSLNSTVFLRRSSRGQTCLQVW